jgi:hypothetical protein
MKTSNPKTRGMIFRRHISANMETIRPLAAGCLLLLAAAGDARACTLWAEVETNGAGGTMISKNRDWDADHTQALKIHRNGSGYAYLGLYAEGNSRPGLKQGVNEKGLTVVSAAASCIPMQMRNAEHGKPGMLDLLLSGFATCDELLAKQADVFSNCPAQFILISDREKIVEVEVGLHGRYVLKTVEKGRATHTNHYLDTSLAEFNVSISASSSTRFGRINELLSAHPASCDIAAFAAMSHDQHDGPANSIWRTSTGVRTMSSWIVETPAQGAPTLRLVTADPDQPQKTNSFVLDENFWKAGSAGADLLKPLANAGSN